MEMPRFHVSRMFGELKEKFGRSPLTHTFSQVYRNACRAVRNMFPENPCDEDYLTGELLSHGPNLEVDKKTTSATILDMQADNTYISEEEEETTLVEFHLRFCDKSSPSLDETDSESYHSIDVDDDEYVESVEEQNISTSSDKNKERRDTNQNSTIILKDENGEVLESIHINSNSETYFMASDQISHQDDNKMDSSLVSSGGNKDKERKCMKSPTMNYESKGFHNEHSIKCISCMPSSGDESDIGETRKKEKQLLTKRQRKKFERIHIKHNMLGPMETFLAKRNRVGYLSSRKYILYDTYTIEKRTKFQKVFFTYQCGLSCENWLMTFSNFSPTQKEQVIAVLTHTFCWPIPYPIIKYEDMKQAYARVLKSKRSELEHLRRALMQNNVQNADFFTVRILTLLAFTFMGEGKLGKALELLEESSSIAYNLEPCEWTGWLYMGYGFYYICFGASVGPADCFEKAAMFLEKAREHFLLDMEKGASMKIGNSLMLWWLFLIESETIKIRSIKGRNSYMKVPIQQTLTKIRKFEWYEAKRTRCCGILESFKQESGHVETFPTGIEKADDIIEVFLKDSQKQKKTAIVDLHRQLVMDLNRNSVPVFIQSMYKNFRLGKIIINVDKDKMNEAVEFVKDSSPGVSKLKVVHFVPQNFSPELIDDQETGPVNSADKLKDDVHACNFLIGSMLIALNEADDKKVQSACENGPVSFKDFPKICGHDDILCGSFGGILINKQNKKFYGTTAMHCLGKCKKEIHKSYESNISIYIEEDIEGTMTIKKLSGKCWGILKSVYKQDTAAVFPDGIDIAVFELENDIFSQPNLEVSQQNEAKEQVKLNLYTESSLTGTCVETTGSKSEKTHTESSLIGTHVEKTGAKSGNTGGYVVLIDMDFRVGDKLCHGNFLVCPDSKSKNPYFGLKGDSGSWVIDKTKDNTEAHVYGYVQSIQIGYSHVPEVFEIDSDSHALESHSDSHIINSDSPGSVEINQDVPVSICYPHVTWCFRLDNALLGLNNTTGWNFDFCIHNPEADSGYSTLEQHTSSDLSPKKENEVLEGAVGGATSTNDDTRITTPDHQIIKGGLFTKEKLPVDCYDTDFEYSNFDDSETELMDIPEGYDSDFSIQTKASIVDDDDDDNLALSASGETTDTG